MNFWTSCNNNSASSFVAGLVWVSILASQLVSLPPSIAILARFGSWEWRRGRQGLASIHFISCPQPIAKMTNPAVSKVEGKTEMSFDRLITMFWSSPSAKKRSVNSLPWKQQSCFIWTTIHHGDKQIRMYCSSRIILTSFWCHSGVNHLQLNDKGILAHSRVYGMAVDLKELHVGPKWRHCQGKLRPSTMDQSWEKEGLFKNRPHATLIFERQMDSVFYWLGEWDQEEVSVYRNCSLHFDFWDCFRCRIYSSKHEIQWSTLCVENFQLSKS